MARITVTVTTADGQHSVTIAPFAQYMWEKDTGQKLSNLEAGTGVGDVARMTWHQLRAQAALDRDVSFEQWLGSVVDLDMAADTDPPQPAGAPSGG